MILSFASSTFGEVSPQVLAALVVLAYLVASWSVSETAKLPAFALVAGWVLHGAWLALDIGAFIRPSPGLRLGFGPVLSLAAWLILAVYAVESRFVPLPAVRRLLAIFGAATMVVAWAFPGEIRATVSRTAPLHWVLGVGSYVLFGAAVLHATMLDSAERRMRLRAGAGQGPLGMPLLRLERLTFRFVEAGFVVLTLAVAMGMITAAQWRPDHKTVFSLLSWGVFAALLVGRHWRGWRGRRATRWLYAGAILLLLAYVGSRFVLEALLHRNPGAP